MTSSFNPGDVVNLKSGGPNMTVVTLTENPARVMCEWFPNADSVKRYSFPSESLERYVPPKV